MHGTDDGSAPERFARSLEDLARIFGRSPVPVLLEVTHRSECPVITTPSEAVDAISQYPVRWTMSDEAPATSAGWPFFD